MLHERPTVPQSDSVNSQSLMANNEWIDRFVSDETVRIVIYYSCVDWLYLVQVRIDGMLTRNNLICRKTPVRVVTVLGTSFNDDSSSLKL